MSATASPRLASQAARLVATVVLPEPPLGIEQDQLLTRQALFFFSFHRLPVGLRRGVEKMGLTG
jgi:hypothetical protein